jgi:hypothetical protein
VSSGTYGEVLKGTLHGSVAVAVKRIRPGMSAEAQQQARRHTASGV